MPVSLSTSLNSTSPRTLFGYSTVQWTTFPDGHLKPGSESESTISAETSDPLTENPENDQQTHHSTLNLASNWLSLALLNTRSLINKLDSFQSFAYSNSLNIICLTETWLNEQIFNNEILQSNFTIHRRDRKHRGGGVLIATSEHITTKLIHTHPTIELIHIELNIKPATHIICIYIPPSCTDEYHQDVIRYLNTLSLTTDTFIVGDFNTPDINWHTLNATLPFSQMLCDFICTNNLIQLVTTPTHRQGNTLDLQCSS